MINRVAALLEYLETSAGKSVTQAEKRKNSVKFGLCTWIFSCLVLVTYHIPLSLPEARVLSNHIRAFGKDPVNRKYCTTT